MKTTVAAIVVTYNRKEWLKECLEVLLAQSYSLQKIYIVNNNSTDGTLEHLMKNGFTDNDKIEVISLFENTGGAGGFYSGLKKAKEDGYNWYWLMDDDCLPKLDCLEQLLNSGKGDYLSPLVLSREDRRTSIWWPNLTSNSGVFQVSSIPFNGALIKHEIVEQQGLPIKEFFIYGDDVEYSFRARVNNNGLYVNTNALLYHPPNRSITIATFFNKMEVPDYNSRIKQYCYLRNNSYLLREYGRILDFKFSKQILKAIYCALFVNKKDIGIVFWAIIHGFTRNLSKTIEFI